MKKSEYTKMLDQEFTAFLDRVTRHHPSAELPAYGWLAEYVAARGDKLMMALHDKRGPNYLGDFGDDDE